MKREKGPAFPAVLPEWLCGECGERWLVVSLETPALAGLFCPGCGEATLLARGAVVIGSN